MSAIDWTQFTKSTVIKADLQALYKAWTVPNELEKWFLKKTAYKRDGEVLSKDKSIQAGDTYTWWWYLYDGQEDNEVVGVNGTDEIKFKFAGDCLVTVKLEQKEEKVIVTLTQSNIPTDDQSMKDIRMGCAGGWAFYLVNLKSFYEHGIDLRNKDERFKGMVNS